MKQILAGLIVPLVLGGSAFAQPPTQQPDTPDDGVGVDYTQPYMNDLLLRMQPWVDGGFILNGRRVTSCEKQRNALAEDPLDPSLNQAYDLCMERRERERKANPPPAPGTPWPDSPRPFDPSEERFGLQSLPPIPAHPNAQN